MVTFAKVYQQTDAITSGEVAKQLSAFKSETESYIKENYGEKLEEAKSGILSFFESFWKAVTGIFA